MLDKLIAEGKEYLFVSNIDNLGSVVDFRILKHFGDNPECEFIMEVTKKTMAGDVTSPWVLADSFICIAPVTVLPTPCHSHNHASTACCGWVSDVGGVPFPYYRLLANWRVPSTLLLIHRIIKE
jgi:hypothetical protein